MPNDQYTLPTHLAHNVVRESAVIRDLPKGVWAQGLTLGHTPDGLLVILVRNADNEIYAAIAVTPMALSTMLAADSAWVKWLEEDAQYDPD